ncbi:MAG TPA: ATP-binding cassette domain-containing protein [Firmicutes bacterium]|nr:ATP-binding cassette domain-containing protein [Bacillota bacterium]
MIQLENVVKKYGDFKAVDDVSLTIPAGKVTSLIGPNGAGKSTLLSVMSRLLKKDGGAIYIDGREIERWDSGKLSQRISILRQANNIDLKLTVRELVSFGRFPYTQGNLTKADWEIVDRSLDYLQLSEMKDKYLQHLSGGQRQRAYLAMVIAQDTHYILLDEPLNNLDMQHAVEMMRILRSLVLNMQKTVVIVIHDINFASCYSDHIVVMRAGQVVAEGGQDVIMNEQVLSGIYNLDFHIEDINDQKICVYYQ